MKRGWVESGSDLFYFYAENGERIARVYGSTLSFNGKDRMFESKQAAMDEFNRNCSANGGSRVKDILQDIKGFMHDNRNMLYWLAVAFLADHFFFGGAFRQRLNALVEKMIGRVEKQLEAK